MLRVGRTAYGVPDPEFPTGMQSERNIRLDRIAGEGDTVIYEYDFADGIEARAAGQGWPVCGFGDGREHELRVEKVMPAEKGKHHPVCLAGKRACPPEDCGGVSGYAHLVEVLKNPRHEEYEELREWAGPDFDPEAFDLDDTNRALTSVR